MRFVAAIAGIVLGLPILLFFLVGTQTFVKAPERTLAIAMSLDAAALLFVSFGLLFTSDMKWAQAIVLGLTVLALAIIYVSMGLGTRHS